MIRVSHSVNKHLMTGPKETVSFVSPTPSMFPEAWFLETLRLRKNNSMFPVGSVIKEAGKGFLLHACLQSTHAMTNMLASGLNIAMVHSVHI